MTAAISTNGANGVARLAENQRAMLLTKIKKHLNVLKGATLVECFQAIRGLHEAGALSLITNLELGAVNTKDDAYSVSLHGTDGTKALCEAIIAELAQKLGVDENGVPLPEDIAPEIVADEDVPSIKGDEQSPPDPEAANKEPQVPAGAATTEDEPRPNADQLTKGEQLMIKEAESLEATARSLEKEQQRRLREREITKAVASESKGRREQSLFAMVGSMAGAWVAQIEIDNEAEVAANTADLAGAFNSAFRRFVPLEASAGGEKRPLLEGREVGEAKGGGAAEES